MSIWRDMHERSNGQKLRKEDENHTHFHTYIKVNGKYVNSDRYFTKEELDKLVNIDYDTGEINIKRNYL